MTDKEDPLATGAALGVLGSLGAGRTGSLVGRQLGDYRIESLIAEGGMSQVYCGVRSDGKFDRKVAIKASPVSGFNEAMRDRFMREQSVLAALNHPNVAQLFDAQVSEDGWPYIVMELVEGEPIVEYCESKHLDLEARLQLLVRVTAAVAFAHARLIVHRDIKPSNVMVNESGQAKLLDFGIAKLLEDEQRALTTDRPMTPRYASPEQLLGEPITTASDVYQLGLLMFEVLTGRPPSKDETITEAIQRAAKREPLPLDRDALDTLPSELRLIIEQCLRVEADERYPDVNALRADLEAWLGGYPVGAAGQGALYRFGKLLRRNATTAAVAAVALVAIVGGSAWYTLQLAEARDLAEQRAATSSRLLGTMSELVAETFEGLVESSTERGVGDESYIESVLADTVAVLDRELTDEDQARAELLRVRGLIDAVLGNNDQAADAMATAYALIDPVAEPERAMQLLLDRIEISFRLLDMDTARLMLDEATDLRDANRFGSGLIAHYEHQVGQVLQFEGDLEGAIAAFERAVALIESEEPVNTRLLAETYEEMAFTFTNWEKAGESLAAATQAIEILEASESPYTHRLVHPLRYAGFANLLLGNNAEARVLYERAQEIVRAAFGETHPDNIGINDSLGALAYREDRLADAAAHFEEMIRIHGIINPDDAKQLVVPKVNAAVVYTDMGRMDRAGQYHEDVLAAVSETDANFQQMRFVVRSNEAKRLFNIGDYAGAARENLAAVEVAMELHGPDHHIIARRLASLANSQIRSGDTLAARDSWRKSLALYIQNYPDKEDWIRDFQLNAWRLHNIDAGEEQVMADLRAAIQGKVDRNDIGMVFWVEWMCIYATYSMKTGDFDSARQMLDWAAVSTPKAPDHPYALLAEVVEAEYLAMMGDTEAAAARAAAAAEQIEALYPLRVDDLQRARSVARRGLSLSSR